MRPTSRPPGGGWTLIAVGLLIVPLSFGASWMLAPGVQEGASEVNGTTLVGVQGPGRGGSVTALAPDGDTLWATRGSPVGETTISYQDVTKLDNGSVLATFADGPYRACGRFASPCKRTGFRIIDPRPTPRVVSEWSYPVRTRKDSEVHDAEPLPSGDVVVADMEYESIFVVDPATGERTWTWNASQHYAPPPDPTRVDWLHINDVDHIGGDRFLVSVRNANQLLVVERGAGVVEVINKDESGSSDASCLGENQLVDPEGDGVRCGDPGVLNKQHNPQWLGPGAVVVADSENDRVVELHRDDETGRWSPAWALTEAGGVSLDWPRDADRLPNGHTLVTDSRNNRVVEVTRDGDVAASLRTRPLPYEADRLPHAESARRPYDTAGGAPTRAGDDDGGEVALLTPLLAGARHVVALPYWVSEGHVFAVALSLVLVAWGGVLVVRD